MASDIIPSMSENQKIFVNQLKQSEKISTIFLVARKDVRLKKDGGSFISLKLADKTGSIPAVIWDNVDTLKKSFKEEDIVSVSGSVQLFDSRLQLKVDKLEKYGGDYTLSDFLPSYEGDIEALMERLMSLMNTVGDEYLKQLLKKIFLDDELSKKFKVAPAAVNMHHSYLGGLLEHTVSVAELGRQLAAKYNADHDLLVTAALLHDIGKVNELSVGKSINYSQEGRLVGHISIADALVSRTIATIKGFPDDLAWKLRHILLSHHGELEWGSPKRPKMLEAVILHHIDNLDAKVGMFMKAVSSLDEESEWTDSRNPFKRSLFYSPPL